MGRRPILVLGAIALLTGAADAKAPHLLHYLTADDVAPTRVLPPPPATGSPLEQAELGEVRAIIASASPARHDQALWDQEHEDPGLFDKTLGLDLEKLPLTWALLKDVQDEATAAVDLSKAYYHRTRPWGVDPGIASCERAPEHKPTNSYPSGHAILGFSVGFVLADLIPARAPDILARAADYGYSREVCGVHFPSDIEASHALGTLVAIKLLANPAFKAKLEAARQELRAAKVTGA